MSPEEASRLIETGDVHPMFDLVEEGRLAEADANKLDTIFGSISVGEALGPEILVEFQPTGSPDGSKAQLILQEREASDGDNCLAVLDPISKVPIAHLDYNVDGATLDVVMIRVQTRHQNFGLPIVLAEHVLKLEPGITKIKANLEEANVAALERALEKKIKVPFEKAIQKTPAYKTASQLGFTDIKVLKVAEIKKDGTIVYSYMMLAKKPKPAD